MEMQCIIGIAMIVAFFGALFVLMGTKDSRKVAVGVYLMTIGILGWVALAVYFLSHCFLEPI